MEYIAVAIIVTIMNVLAFIVGAMIGQKSKNNEEIKLPNINPVTLYKEHQENEVVSKEQKKINDMLYNINNYRGDAYGQKDID